MAECAIRCMECHALLRDCTTGELTWPGGVSRSPPSPDMCKALTSPPLPHRHGGRPRTSRPASRLTAPASSSAAFARLPALLTGRDELGSQLPRGDCGGQGGRATATHYHSLCPSTHRSSSFPASLLPKVHLARAGRDCGGTAGVTCPAVDGGQERAGGGEKVVRGRRSQLDLDANHNLRSKQGSKTVFPHPYTFDI